MHLGEELFLGRPAGCEVLVEEEATRAGDELEPGGVLHPVPVCNPAARVDGDRIRERLREAGQQARQRLRRRFDLSLVDGDKRWKPLSLCGRRIGVERLELRVQVCDLRLPGVEEEDEMRS